MLERRSQLLRTLGFRPVPDRHAVNHTSWLYAGFPQDCSHRSRGAAKTFGDLVRDHVLLTELPQLMQVDAMTSEADDTADKALSQRLADQNVCLTDELSGRDAGDPYTCITAGKLKRAWTTPRTDREDRLKVGSLNLRHPAQHQRRSKARTPAQPPMHLALTRGASPC